MEDMQSTRQRPQMTNATRPSGTNRGQARLKSQPQGIPMNQNGQMEEQLFSDASPYIINVISNTHRLVDFFRV